MGKEGLRVLEELKTEFPGKIFLHFILFIQLYLMSVRYHRNAPFLRFLLYWAASKVTLNYDHEEHIGIHFVINAAGV